MHTLKAWLSVMIGIGRINESGSHWCHDQPTGLDHTSERRHPMSVFSTLFTGDRVVDAAVSWAEATGTPIPRAVIELAAETA